MANKPKYDKKIIKHVPDYPVSVTDLSEWSKTSRQTVWYALPRLERLGCITVHGRNKNRKPLKITANAVSLGN
jgi:DNA-binding PadR family transcriptional regulator